MAMQDSTVKAGRRETEKRSATAVDARGAAVYFVVAIAIELGILLGYILAGGVAALAWASPSVLGTAGLVALGVSPYAYLRRRSWIQWQATGWLLLMLAIVAMAMPAALVAGAEPSGG